ALDASSSMGPAMRQAQQAAVDFLETVVGPRDQAFAIAFPARPDLALPPTPVGGAVARAREGIAAAGRAALYAGTAGGPVPPRRAGRRSTAASPTASTTCARCAAGGRSWCSPTATTPAARAISRRRSSTPGRAAG